jgi:hypothetical protein
VGENGFGPLGIRGAFSVGSAGGCAAGEVVVVVVVVVEVSGAFSSSLAHAAESPTKAMIAATPATAGMQRAGRCSMIFLSTPQPSTRTAGCISSVETLSV